MPIHPNNREKIALLTDTCADISPELAQEKGITLLPLKIGYPEGDYLDGVDITAEDVYRRMPAEAPKTSLPDGAAILGAFDRIRAAGYEKVIALIFSSGISGTYNAVRVLAESYEGLEIAVFDTKTASLGLGMIVLRTAEDIEAGVPFAELTARLPGLIDRAVVFFSLDTLEYLQKGGRIGKVTCVAGTMLQIKPVIAFAPDGQLVSVGKVRGRANSIAELARRIRERMPAGSSYTMAMAHGGCPEDMEALKSLLAEEIRSSRCFYEGEIDCTLASHVGPHLIGVGILRDDE